MLIWELFLLIVLLALLAEYVDSSLGMGYGTTLTPILLLLGFSSLQVVPAVLLSEFVTGMVAAGFHHALKNVNFRRSSLDFKVALLLTTCGFAGAVIAVLLAVELPDKIVKTYIGVLVLTMGFLIIFTPHGSLRFSWRRLVGLGLLSAFNKGISGGGYGPVITAGQILSGLNPKSSVGIASLSEGLISLIGATAYAIIARSIPWSLTVPLLIGSVTSTPLAAYTVKKLHFKHLRLAIGILAALLGTVTLIKALS